MYSDIWSPQVDGADLKEPSRAGSPSLRLHSFWNVEPIYVQVNKTVFVVPREAFLGSNRGSLFEAVGRSSPSVAVKDIEGLSKTRPIVLENVTEHELEIFLQVIYPVGLSEKLKLDITFENWIGVLRLSTIWNHDAARKQAIDSLTKIIESSDDAASMLRLGKELSVARWTRDAYISLIRNTSIGMEELAKEPFEFDWETIAKILQAKYDAVPKYPYSKRPRSCLYCNESHFTSSGTLQICLCRATAMFEKYFPQLNDFEITQTTSTSTFANAGYP